MELWELLGVRPGVTALIGGGGKTTAMYTLAWELCQKGTVICASTTHIAPPDHLPTLYHACETEVSEALSVHGCICLGTLTEEGKLTAPALPWRSSSFRSTISTWGSAFWLYLLLNRNSPIWPV